MIALMTSVLLAASAPAIAPAPAADAHKDHAKHQGMKHEGECTMDCCKGDKPMPCCEKMKAKAEAPAAEGHGGHEHDH
ncbi:hypothetical protein [Sphingomonas sp. LHG3406-1]|uniref:hypothetical protein n=1 Tax=Sphingomonas sp. LHG3406-1 TaxID=2804617 RepID=UPI00262700CF|nr:hypothetical protein [Sphingomonas sp. LHG3406-1]